MTQSISGVVDGLYAAARGLYAAAVTEDGAPILVTYGMPGTFQPNGIVAIGTEIRGPVTRPTMGTNRSRETTAEVDSVISVYVAGDESSQQLANVKAWALLAQLEAYFRTSPNETLGGACRDSWVSSHNLVPSVAYQQYDDPNAKPVATGRVAEITVTVTAAIRN